MTEQTPHYADDPDAPYFEHLYAAAQSVRPEITRAEALATIQDADPNDTLRIREPRPADGMPVATPCPVRIHGQHCDCWSDAGVCCGCGDPTRATGMCD